MFRESEGLGIQVYFSPEGNLCYKPKESVYVIDLDVALEVYGYEKISRSLRNALKIRNY